MATGGREIHALTSLRFFAAAAIVLHHSQGNFGVPLRVGAPFVLDHAVSFFFVLSGFILTHIHGGLAKGQRSAFLVARIARIWPGHIGALALLLVVFGAYATDSGVFDPSVFISNALLLQAWIPFRSYFFSYNGATWSVSAELFFYVTFPFLVHRLERTWHAKFLLALGIAFALIAIGNFLQLPAEETDGVIGADALVYIHPLARWWEFVLGMCTALAYRRLASLRAWSLIAGTAIELCTAAVVLYVMSRTNAWASALGKNPVVGLCGTVWLVHGPLAAPAFALGIAVLGLQRGLLSRLLSLPGLVLLGEISYAMYLLHVGVLRIFWRKLPAVALASDPWIYPSVWLLLLALSHLFWSLIEKPGRARIARLRPLQRASADAAAESPPRPTALRSQRGNLVLVCEAIVAIGLLTAFALFSPPSA
jgi:peptidoglycan/LPS O-acetylase OafA/YrhL